MRLNILDHIKKNKLLNNGEKVLVAVSGGPDSLALLHWLHAQRQRWGLHLGVAHVNHQFRGESAEGDQRFVEAICQEWGITCHSTKIDVPAYAREHKLSKQVAARVCRYHFFEQLAKEYRYQKLAVAHHADDQLETVLMRLSRGAGLQGLSGIPVQRKTELYTIIRPFLPLSKEQIEAYCDFYSLESRIDESNLEDDYTRNYIRHHLVPQFKKLNPNIDKVIVEMTETIAQENEFMEELSSAYLEQILQSKAEDSITVALPFFLDIALPLQRRLILLLLNYLSSVGSDWKKIHIDQVLDLIHQNKGYKYIQLPQSLMVIREYDSLILIRQNEQKKREIPSPFCYELPTEGEYVLAYPNLRVCISKNAPSASVQTAQGKPSTAYVTSHSITLDVAQLSPPLMLRNRRPGDKIRPLGMEGQQKVKDIFIDAKIPVSARSTWPLLVDQQGILWIPGLKKAERGKVFEGSRETITIQIDKIEEERSSVR